MVDAFELVHLQPCMFQHPHSASLSTVVERWQPDANIFHMSFGEVTITLHDVELILGQPTYSTIIETKHMSEQLHGIVNIDFDVRYMSSEKDSFT